jgi:hypothetical protein
MGLCASFCGKSESAKDKAGSALEGSITAASSHGRDSSPLLNGPTLLAFSNLRLPDSSSSSVEVDLTELDQMLQQVPGPGSKPKKEVDGTFREVNPDLKLAEIASADSQDDE